jgi:hypothetical protein
MLSASLYLGFESVLAYTPMTEPRIAVGGFIHFSPSFLREGAQQPSARQQIK